jgi:hypothetical protein
MVFEAFEPVPSGRGADPAGCAVRNPQDPKPHTGSAAADPDFDWT